MPLRHFSILLLFTRIDLTWKIKKVIFYLPDGLFREWMTGKRSSAPCCRRNRNPIRRRGNSDTSSNKNTKKKIEIHMHDRQHTKRKQIFFLYFALRGGGSTTTMKCVKSSETRQTGVWRAWFHLPILCRDTPGRGDSQHHDIGDMF